MPALFPSRSAKTLMKGALLGILKNIFVSGKISLN